ncbi:MAG: histidine phosphatase family protein [Hyphomicrobium sp.]
MREPRTIYLIRHGETDWNRDRRYQGQRDIPLNDKGRTQAKRNGEALRALLPGIANADFIASPLGRARETMEIVRRELGLPPERYAIDDRIKELNYGHWEGMLQDDLPMIDPRGLAVRSIDPFRWRPDHGESYADLLVRVVEWFGSLERDAVVAAHGGVSRCLRAHVLGLDPNVIPDLESPQDRVLVISRGEMRWM